MSKVAVNRCSSYDPETVYLTLVDSISTLGLDRPVASRGEKLLLKPNLLSAKPVETAVTTHPAVIEAVVRVVKELGGVPFIGDSPGIGSARQVATKTGLADIASRHAVKIVDLSDGMEVENSSGKTFRRLDLSRTAVEADAIINIPKLKTHSMMTMTLGVKNLFGCVPGKRKVSWHFEAGHDKAAFARMLVEGYRFLNPRLTILDGVVGMEGNGPGSGTPREMGIMAAAIDAVAMDMVIGMKVGFGCHDLPTTRAAIELGIGETDPEKVRVVGSAADITFPDFIFPDTTEPRFMTWMPAFIQRRMTEAMSSRPAINHDLCKQCGICVNSCPPKVMKITDRLTIDYDNCIRCYCCHELCPDGAIDIKKGWAARLLAGR